MIRTCVLMLTTLLTSTVTGQNKRPTLSGLRPDAPAYAIRGPYPVGFRTTTSEAGSYPLSVAVWYPARNPDGLPEKVTYPAVSAKLDGIPADRTMPSHGHALQDALPDLSGGAYPLIIYSHGFASHSSSAAYLTEHLASHGFVILAPDHPEKWDSAYSEIWAASVKRPLDVRRTIHLGEQLTAAGGALAGMIDTNQIGVTGHSYGGFTALLMGGARFDFEALKTACARLAPDHTIGALCQPLLSHQADMAQLAGLDSVPEGLWPSWGDPRIKAIVPTAGETELLGAAGLANIHIPVLMMNGGSDQIVPSEWSAEPTWENISSQQKAVVLLEYANHHVFGGKCEDFPWPLELGWYGSCSDPVWDMDRAHDLINHFTAAFFLDILKGDADAHAALAPDAVRFPAVTYQAVGF